MRIQPENRRELTRRSGHEQRSILTIQSVAH